jgi:hypothetical protein
MKAGIHEDGGMEKRRHASLAMFIPSYFPVEKWDRGYTRQGL